MLCVSEDGLGYDALYVEVLFVELFVTGLINRDGNDLDDKTVAAHK